MYKHYENITRGYNKGWRFGQSKRLDESNACESGI